MKKEIKILGTIAVIVAVVALIGANYYVNYRTEKPRTGASGPAESLVREDSPTLGPADAKVTIVEFLDPECEACSAFYPAVKKVLQDFDGQVRFVVRIMPFHPNSMLAANFIESAGEQGKYWEAQEMLLKRQPEWGLKHGQPPAPLSATRALFEKYAMDLGLDVEKVNAAIDGNRFAAKIERDRQDGQRLGVRQTPTFFVNGRRLARLDEASLRYLIEAELKK